jgi:hypothetical protein
LDEYRDEEGLGREGAEGLQVHRVVLRDRGNIATAAGRD